MVFKQFFQLRLVTLSLVPQCRWQALPLLGLRQHLVQRHHGGVAASGKLSVFVIHISDTAAHAGGKVAPGFSQHGHGAAGHVLATMVASALNHCGGTRQAHRKALAGHAAKECLPAGGAIHHCVAHDGVAHRLAPKIDAGAHHHAAARQALAGVVVGVANQVERDAAGQKGGKGLAASAFELDADGVVRQSQRVHLGECARQHGTDRAVDIARHFHELHPLATVDGRAAFGDQALVERLLQAVVLALDLVPGHLGADRRHGKQTAKIQAAGFPVVYALAHVEQIGPTNQVVELADAELRHDLARLLGNKKEIINHMLWLASEFFAQCRVLRGNTNRTGIEVTLSHHDAALDHQRRGSEPKLISTQQGAYQHIAASFHLAVGLHPDAAPQPVEHQSLLGFCQAYLPGAAGMLDAGPGRSAGTAIMAGNHHMVALALGHARGNGTHANFAHQLDTDAGMRCHVFQVVDELRQVFNGINVVVRRRRDQAHAGHRVAQLANVVTHLAAGQLAALARLGSLRHLDLDLVGAGEVLGGDTKTA